MVSSHSGSPNTQDVSAQAEEAEQDSLFRTVSTPDTPKSESDEHELAANLARSSAAKLRLVMDSVTEHAIITLDAHGVISGWNAGAEHIFGWTQKEAIGQPIVLLFTPDDCAAGVPEAEMRQARDEGRAADERWHLRKDGTRFWASGIMSLLEEGKNLIGYVKVARDLTEQRQAAEAIRASEARFHTLSDAIPQIIWTNDANGYADYFNARWFDYSGLTLEESLGLGWQAIVHPDDAPASIQRWQEAQLRGEVFDTEYRLRTRDGHYRWQIGRNVPLRDEQGRVLGWFGTATDVQELKETQEALRQAHDALEALVQERTVELEQMRIESEQRRELEAIRAELVKRVVNTQEEERGRISRELHDNLGQHLTAISLGLQGVEMQVEKLIGGKRKQNAPQLDRLRALVDGLMKAAHRQAWELRPAELDAMGLEAALGQYVRDWRERAGVEADFQAIGWEDRPHKEIETTLYRVVQEALTNVARHARASRVSVILQRTDSMATVIVEDDGQGFDTEQSTGRLGVLGMRERLDLVGGTLEIESIPDDGTTVFAHVPL